MSCVGSNPTSSAIRSSTQCWQRGQFAKLLGRRNATSEVGTHLLRQRFNEMLVLYMTFNSTKEKGRAGLSAAIAYFGMNGYTVSIPLNDTQDYDIVVEKENVFYKVQCRSTGAKSQSGHYKVKLDSWGGMNGGTKYGTIKSSSAHLLFVLTENKEMYVIPVTNITTNSSLTLNYDYKKYQVYF